MTTDIQNENTQILARDSRYKSQIGAFGDSYYKVNEPELV